VGINLTDQKLISTVFEDGLLKSPHFSFGYTSILERTLIMQECKTTTIWASMYVKMLSLIFLVTSHSCIHDRNMYPLEIKTVSCFVKDLKVKIQKFS